MIEIRDSSIPNAGIGVWSTQFIPKDSFVTEYYGEHLSRDEFTLFEGNSLLHFSSEKLDELRSRRPYLRIQDEVYVFGDPNSRDISKCGQLINDGFTVLDFKDDFNEISLKTVELYEDRSADKSSIYTLYQEGKLLCYASNDILPNQELFHSYGGLYWLNYFNLNVPKELNIYNLTNQLVSSVRLKKLLTKSNI